MSRIGLVGGIASVVEGAWALYFTYAAQFFFVPFCPIGVGCAPLTFSQTGIFSLMALALGIASVIDGALGVWGARVAYPAGMVLSLLLLLTMGYAYYSDSSLAGSYGYLTAWKTYEVVAIILAALGLAGNWLAMRERNRFPEQANPMNLPVFG